MDISQPHGYCQACGSRPEQHAELQELIKERIILAAVQVGETTFVGKPGQRHGDIFQQIRNVHPVPDFDHIQGFLTSTGRFVNRNEAWTIAKEANQFLRGSGSIQCLISEDVW